MQVALLLAGGLPLYDALTHTFSTIATGGFSPRAASVGAYDSAFVDAVVTVFMLLAAVNFSLYFQVFRRNPAKLFSNLELRAFICIYVVAAALVTLSVTGTTYDSLGRGVRFAAFQAASLLTGTGFTTADYDGWPNMARAVLLIIMFVGGCSGSTAGGIKVIRVATLFKQALNEFRRLIHPQGIFTLRIGDRRVKKDILYPVAMFFFLYIGMVLLTTLVVASFSPDLTTAFTTGPWPPWATSAPASARSGRHRTTPSTRTPSSGGSASPCSPAGWKSTAYCSSSPPPSGAADPLTARTHTSALLLQPYFFKGITFEGFTK